MSLYHTVRSSTEVRESLSRVAAIRHNRCHCNPYELGCARFATTIFTLDQHWVRLSTVRIPRATTALKTAEIVHARASFASPWFHALPAYE